MKTSDNTHNWEAACPLEALREGTPKGLKLKGIPIALYKIGDSVYATHDICTHAYAHLSDGFIEDHTIECPLHGALFDVRDGKCLAVASSDLQTFPIKIADGTVSVLLPGADGDENG